MVFAPAHAQLELVSRKTAEVFPDDELRAKLAEGRPLRVKFGVDPTAEHVTLGWAVPLRKLRELQDLGHTAVLIVGDFTARIGDPSGRDRTRPMLDKAQVRRFAERVLQQFGCILRSDRLEIRRNSEWLEPLGLEGLLRIASRATVGQLLQRRDFAKRLAAREALSVRELCYPLLQGYDSVAVRADVEIGGTDQTFNLAMGRDVQRAFGQPAQAIVTMPLLEGTDGVEKMSQSRGNFIGITEAPEEMFGKLMRLPDHLMTKFYRLAAWAAEDDTDAFEHGLASGTTPAAQAKRRLAEDVVALCHDPAAARSARDRFDRVHVRHEVPDDVRTVPIPEACVDGGAVDVPRLLAAVGLAASISEGRRLLRQRGVHLDGDTLAAERVAPADLHGRVLRRGSRTFVRLAQR